MTGPNPLAEPTTIANEPYEFPLVGDDEAHITLLPVLGQEIFAVRPAADSREALITRVDLDAALVTGNPVTPAWSNPELVIGNYGLGALRATATTILRDMFGAVATLTPEIVVSPESGYPALVLRLRVPRALGGLRHDFLRRYVRETAIPDHAPAPVILWEYLDAVPA